MKTRKTIFGIFTAMALFAITTLALITCDNGDDKTHTHQWEWVETKAATTTEEGQETETCACGATNRTRAIPKVAEVPVDATHDLYLKDKKIVVHYQKKASEPVPEYMTIIQEKFDSLAAFADENPTSSHAKVINNLRARGGDFSIIVEYTTPSYTGVGTVDGRTLKVHNDWVSIDTNVTGTVFKNAFEAMLALPDPSSQPCACTEGTTHEGDDQCCEGTDCNCQIAEPEVKEFTVSFDFANPGNPNEIYNANIEDARTACGSADLQNVKIDNKNIVTIIEEAIQGSFNTKPTNNAQRGRFRNVFYNDGVTIIVNNPETPYKVKAPDTKTIYFHIDYLKSSPSDIQQKVFDMISAMNDGGASLPYEAE